MNNKTSVIHLKISRIYALYQTLFFFIFGMFFWYVQKIFPNPIPEFQREYELFFPFIFGVLFLKAAYEYLYFRLQRIEIYKDQIIYITGVFSKKLDFIELYRVKDYKSYQSFFMRIFNLMSFTLITSDKSKPIFIIKGVKKSNIVETIRAYVEEQRKTKGVREFD